MSFDARVAGSPTLFFFLPFACLLLSFFFFFYRLRSLVRNYRARLRYARCTLGGCTRQAQLREPEILNCDNRSLGHYAPGVNSRLLQALNRKVCKVFFVKKRERERERKGEGPAVCFLLFINKQLFIRIKACRGSISCVGNRPCGCVKSGKPPSARRICAARARACFSLIFAP